ncbi:hypothetical protein [Sphingobacterium allocomposti]|uniref:hypothetical protein n=1 Tax=Sphingobacterium allocomposti TaxID=415956 RepID=UPI0014787355|nr:hypothetical protein [Sphingobacterium composti Yoo et al. 2007 non Ten et al. 2007]
MKNTHTLVLRRKYGEQGTNGTVTYQERTSAIRSSCPTATISPHQLHTRGAL